MFRKFLSKKTLDYLHLYKKIIFNQLRTRELIYNKLYFRYFTFINGIKHVYEDEKKYIVPRTMASKVIKSIQTEIDFLTEMKNTERLFNLKKINPYDLSNGLYHAPLLSARKLINSVQNKNNYHFIDIGSGLGVLLFYVCLNYDFESYTGIELNNRFYELSKQNLNKKKLRAKKIFLENISAHKFSLDQNKKYIIFFYNPFDIYILEKFLQKNYHIIKKNNSIILFQGASVQRSDRVFSKFNFQKKVIDYGLTTYYL